MDKNFETILAESAWNPAEQQIIARAVPSLGPVFVETLLTRMQASSFKYETGIWLHTVEASQDLVPDLRSGNWGALEVFTTSLDEPLFDFGKAWVPMATDLLDGTVPDVELTNPEAISAVAGLAELYIDLVPDRSFLLWIQSNLLHYFAPESLTEVFKRRRVGDWNGFLDDWADKYLVIIKKNQELLGQKIVVGGSELAPTVEHWLQEYDAFAGKSALDRHALDRLHYVQNNENAKALSKPDQAILLSMCELYDWLANPVVEDLEETLANRPAATSERDASIPVQEETNLINEGIVAPNIQGVLVQTPLGISENSGLDVAPTFPNISQPKEAEPRPIIKSVVEKVIPPKELPVQSSTSVQKMSTNKPVSDSVGTPTPTFQSPRVPLATPVFKKPVPIAKLAKPVPSMDRLKQEAEAKRNMVQGEIDEKLEGLKKRGA